MSWPIRPRQSGPEVCDTILPLLSLQADGMASADETRRVESHLSSCDDCRRAQSWMQATHLAIAQRPLVLPPPDLRARIAQAVAAQAAPVVFTTRRPFVRRPAFAAAASVALAAAWLGHSLLTAHPTAPGVSPPHVAVTPPAPPTPAVKPNRLVHGPTRLTAKAAPAPIRTAPINTIERVATAVHAAPPRLASPEPTVPAITLRPAAHPKAASHAPLIANAPAPAVAVPVKPRTTPHIPRVVLEAMAPKPAPRITAPEVTPAPTVSPAPAPTVAAVRPEETVAPAPAREHPTVQVARREDVLSGVRAHLTSSRSDNSPRQISRDGGAHVRSASYASNDNLTPYYGMVYTPTHQDH